MPNFLHSHFRRISFYQWRCQHFTEALRVTESAAVPGGRPLQTLNLLDITILRHCRPCIYLNILDIHVLNSITSVLLSVGIKSIVKLRNRWQYNIESLCSGFNWLNISCNKSHAISCESLWLVIYFQMEAVKRQ